MPNRLKEFLQRWLITTAGVLVAAHIVPHIYYDTWQGLLIATLVLGLLNAFVRPLLMFLSLPLLILSLGLFTLIINALLLYFVGQVMKDFHVATFGAAFWGGLIISLVTLVLNLLTGTGNTRIEVRRHKRVKPSRGKFDDDNGPVIDV